MSDSILVLNIEYFDSNFSENDGISCQCIIFRQCEFVELLTTAGIFVYGAMLYDSAISASVASVIPKRFFSSSIEKKAYLPHIVNNSE